MYGIFTYIPGSSGRDLWKGVLFVTFSGVLSDLHLRNQKGTWEEAGLP